MLSGRTFAITGANTGVGRATAFALAERGADLILLCRSRERSAKVISDIASIPGAGSCELIRMDLSDLASVRSAADRIRDLDAPIEVLINNAGVGGARGVTADGFELAFGVNYLGHYLLTRLLIPELRPAGRVVHVSSGSHEKVRQLDFESFGHATRSLTGIAEYAASKLCVMLFHHELTRRLEADGLAVASIAADPGDVASDAWRNVPWFVRPLIVCGMKSPEEGARTSLYCATSLDLLPSSGGFFVDENRCEASSLSKDTALARALWNTSAAYTGLAA